MTKGKNVYIHRTKIIDLSAFDIECGRRGGRRFENHLDANMYAEVKRQAQVCISKQVEGVKQQMEPL